MAALSGLARGLLSRGRAPGRYLLLAAIVGSALVVPGSAGWAGAVAQGDGLVRQHRLLSGIAHYQRAELWQDRAAPIHARLAVAHLRRGQAREAADRFRRGEESGRAGPEVLLGLASALDQQGDVGGGIGALRRELNLRPGNVEAWARLVERAARAAIPPVGVGDLLEGVPDPPLDGPLGPRAAYLLGACVLGTETPAGQEALRRAAAGSDERAASAARELLDALSPGGGDPSGANSLARALLAQGLVGPGLAHLQRVDAAGLLDAEGLALMGSALLEARRPEEAEESVRRSLELAPGNPLAEFVRAKVLRRRGDAEGAVAVLRRLVGRERDNPAVQIELANALLELGDYGNADGAMRLAVEAAPDDAELRLAVVRFRVDRQYRAGEIVEDAREAVRLSGRSAAALGALGWALHLAGREQEALEPLLGAVDGDPESPLLRYRLGSVYEGLGQVDRAREQYLMVRELDGSGFHWSRARAAMEGLGPES